MAARTCVAMRFYYSCFGVKGFRRKFILKGISPCQDWQQVDGRHLIFACTVHPRRAYVTPPNDNSLNKKTSPSSESSDLRPDKDPRSLVPWQKKEIAKELPKAYDPGYVESVWYDWWEEKGVHKPPPFQDLPKKKKMIVCLPPPNVTGSLHLGHALTCSIQDAIVRWHRMRGHQVLWVPGTDHAGIATQIVVEKHLWKKKITKLDIGREKFLEEVWKWKNEKGSRISEQMRRLGASLDWSREYFTMDEKLSKAVVEAFVSFHEEGLIYRSNRLVNWSCHLQSAISDIEVEMIPLEGKKYLKVPGYEKMVEFGILTSFAYPVIESGEEIVVSTTRPETMLGDVAVAVHPQDERYTHLHGKLLQHPFSDRQIPIILDEFVDREMGSGAVKITPSHDYVDYEIGLRHNLPINHTVIGSNGNMSNVPPQFEGMKRFEARTAIVQALKEKGFYRGSKDHAMILPVCSRSQDIVEPLLKEQWFLDCKNMATEALQAVNDDMLRLIPDHHNRTWFHWLENVKDWCISRQLWWGHRIPAYYATHCDENNEQNAQGHWVSARNEEEALAKASNVFGVPVEHIHLKQDEDVLDTWFSSALIPFSVFGWPEKTDDLKAFYPTKILETGSDILFFWVSRMVMLGKKLTGKLPFEKVLLHGIIRDSEGKKMSKSLGNVIDPMDLIHGKSLEGLQKGLLDTTLDAKEIEITKKAQKKAFPGGVPQCGADALRLALCSYNFKLQTINIEVDHVKSCKLFCNKLWQASKFLHSNLGEDFVPKRPFEPSGYESSLDNWILSNLCETVQHCDKALRSYDINQATHQIRQFWHQDICDTYIEAIKPVLQSGTEEEKEALRQILHFCLETTMQLLSPFMPYLTEELYQHLQQRQGNLNQSICNSHYPKPRNFPWTKPFLNSDMAVLRALCKEALFLRKEFDLTKARANILISSSDEILIKRLERNYTSPLTALSRSKSIEFVTGILSIPPGYVSSPKTVNNTCQVHMQLQDLVDPVIEMKKISKKVKSVLKELEKAAATFSKNMKSNNPIDEKKLKQVQNLNSDVERLQSYVAVLENLKP